MNEPMTEKEAYEKAMDEYVKLLKEAGKRDRQILDQIKEDFGEDWHSAIEDYLCECELETGTLKIVDKAPYYGWQEEKGWIFKKACVHQSCGYAVDDYHGDIWVPLPNKKYLQFYYQM